MPTILDKMIEEINTTELNVKKAVEEERLSKRAGQMLVEESIKMMIAIQGNRMLAALMQPADEQLVQPALNLIVKN